MFLKKINFKICIILLFFNFGALEAKEEPSLIMPLDVYKDLAPGESIGVPVLVKYDGLKVAGVIEGKSISNFSSKEWDGYLPEGLKNLNLVLRGMGLGEPSNPNQLVLYVGYKYCKLCNSLTSDDSLISSIKDSFKSYDFRVIEIDHMRYLEQVKDEK